jgi:predicted RNA-binding protein with PIN domain
MALLIDGYNLLNATGIFAEAGPGTELHRNRLALLNFLASSIEKRERAKTTIVFDAGGAPPGLPRTTSHEGITVHFAPRHSDADEMIEDLLERCAAPRSLLVVSSDHRVQRAARHRGAGFIDSEKWYGELLAASRRSQAIANEANAKPVGEMSSDELKYWLGEFGEADSAEDISDNPFPPGSVDDIGEQD